MGEMSRWCLIRRGPYFEEVRYTQSTIKWNVFSKLALSHHIHLLVHNVLIQSGSDLLDSLSNLNIKSRILCMPRPKRQVLCRHNTTHVSPTPRFQYGGVAG